MTIPITGLSNCDLEPIHIPGKIQSHGFLLVIDNNAIIRFISINAQEFAGVRFASFLDKPLQHFEQLLKSDTTPVFLTNLLFKPIGGPGPSYSLNSFKIKLGTRLYNLIVSPSDTYTLLEFEPVVVTDIAPIQTLINESVPGLLGVSQLNELLDYAAVQVKAIIKYDRVMIYRFAPDGHGEVVAEAKNEQLNPWLGLHYPASDIPLQARELYKLNITRLIADVNATDTAIAATNSESVLDLTFSQLRAVSPVHIQYLKNMGVASSYSISLICKKELWGLIACHNYTPKFIDYETRSASKLVGQIVSAAVEFRQHSQDLQTQTLLEHHVDILTRYLNSKSSIEEALTTQEVTLINVVHATGAVLCYDNKKINLGRTPDEVQMAALVKWINNNHPGDIFCTASLYNDYPPAESYKQVVAGMMVIPLTKEPNEYVIWFKEEFLQQVRWAGDPAKPVTLSAEGIPHISPRHSFDTWVKTVTGHSAEWMPEEVNAALRLKEEILTAISSKAIATRVLNEGLRLAYEELDTFSYTVSHDLKTPLTAIKGYAQLLALEKDISIEGRQMLQRITGRADKMNFMIKSVLEYSRIGRLQGALFLIDTAEVVKEIIQDMEQTYQTTGVRITTGDIPSMRGDPVMIWQVFSNLIGNAVKYSQHAQTPAVHIKGWTSETQIFYSIKDNGIGIAHTDLDNIFLLFSRSANVGDIEGSGVGLAIVKKIVEKHAGIIWTESELGIGTTFFLSFNVA